MRGFLLFLVMLFFLASCSEGGKSRSGGFVADKYELMDVDKAFSALCREKGMKQAFIEYLDSNGVLLLPGRAPVEGANAVDYIISQDDSEYQLSWKPRDGFVSSSGDLGYTFGLYSLRLNGPDSLLAGNYVTVWKKQQDGKWKFVLYSGSEGQTGFSQ